MSPPKKTPVRSKNGERDKLAKQFIEKHRGGEINNMWTIEKLKNRFSMSDQQIYRRLNAAQRPLGRHINRGEKNAIVLSEGGFLILENVIEFEKQGKTLASAVQEVEKALSDTASLLAPSAPERHVQETPSTNTDKLYETKIQSLIEQVGYLKGKMDSKDELLAEMKSEVARLRQENSDLKRSVALVEYKAERKSWWPWK